MDLLQTNIDCQMAIILVAHQFGWSDSLERDLLALGNAEQFLISKK